MELLNFLDRRLILLSVSDGAAGLSQLDGTPFALLLEGPIERGAQPQLVERAVVKGCVEIYCVGLESERLHDSMDDLLEAQGCCSVVTTWDADESPAEHCSYFLDVAGARAALLVAVCGEELGTALRLAIVAATLTPED